MQSLENIQDLIKLAGIRESKKEKEVEEGNFFTRNLKKAREQGKEKADLDGDGDLETVQKEGVFKSPRDIPAKDLVKVPAIQRPNRRLNLRDIGIGEPERLGPNPDTGAKSVDIPAYIRKQQGKNFPANLDESQQIDECGMAQGSMSPMGSMAHEMEKSEGRLNISSNFDSESGRKSLTITAEGDRAEELAQLLKRSGMMGGTGMDSEHPRSMNIVGSMDAEGAADLAKMLKHSGLQEAYANEPNPKTMSLDQMLNSGNDLHKKKKSYPKAEDGDNPRAVGKVKESLEQRLWVEFQQEKAR